MGERAGEAGARIRASLSLDIGVILALARTASQNSQPAGNSRDRALGGRPRRGLASPKG